MMHSCLKLFAYSLAAGLLSVAAFAHPPADEKPDGPYAEHIANSGVLVVDGDTKILFDPLFHNSYNNYRLPSDEQRNAILKGTAPYDNIDAIFISHAHGDHFSARDMLLWLTNNPDGLLIAPEQAVEKFKFSDGFDETLWDEEMADRVIGLEFAFGDDPKTIKLKRGIKKDDKQSGLSLKIDSVRIPHAGWPGRADVENLVYRVTLNDNATVIHMGDADPNDVHYAPYEDLWAAKQTHLGFPPYWFFSSPEGRMILKDRLRITEAIGVHVPVKVPADLPQIREEFGLGFFSKPGEWHPITIPHSGPCREVEFEDIPFTVCSVDPRKADIGLFLNNEDGKRWKHFGKLAQGLEAKDQELVFAMNAGMYHRNRNPVGLYVEDFEVFSDANTNDGPGNFHLKPNGVFWIENTEDTIQQDTIRAGVTETGHYLKSVPETNIALATQSGPMLVIDGELHPKFLENSKSKFRRNGVGVDGGGIVHFAISDAVINFHTFARFFRDELKTLNALFLDGKVSRVYAPGLDRHETGNALGPMIGVTRPLKKETKHGNHHAQ